MAYFPRKIFFATGFIFAVFLDLRTDMEKGTDTQTVSVESFEMESFGSWKVISNTSIAAICSLCAMLLSLQNQKWLPGGSKMADGVVP